MIRLKLRTVFSLVTLSVIAAIGALIIMVSLIGAMRTSLEFAERFSDEIAVDGLEAIESVITDAERVLRTSALFSQDHAERPDLSEALARFLVRYRASAHHLKCAMVFINASTGEGCVVHRKGNSEAVKADGRGGFKAIDHITGKQRAVPDMRNLQWFKSALDEGGPGMGNFHGFSGTWHNSDNRGINAYIPVQHPSRQGQLLGVIAIDITTEWIGEYLSKSMRKFSGKSESFVVERLPDGTLNMIAHTSHAMKPGAADEIGDGVVNPEKLNDPLLNEAIRMIIHSDSGLEYAESTHVELRTPVGDYLATFMNVMPGRKPCWSLCVLLNKDDLLAPLKRRLLVNLSIVTGGLVAALSLAIWAAMRTARPIEEITSVALDMGKLKFDAVPCRADSRITEVDKLAKAIESMRAGLKAFLQYLPEDLLRRYLAPGAKAETGGDTCPATILFTDIKDFSSISERQDPIGLVRHLNEYLEILSSSVAGHHGTVDKYIGDSLMAFWNAPIKLERHAREACAAALDCRKILAVAGKRWQEIGLPLFETRFGIHTGEVIVGNIGSSVRLNYTIIGDAVNLASRLEGLNKEYGTSILISESTRAEAGDEFLTRPVDLVAVKGKLRSNLIHELMAWRGEASDSEIRQARMTTIASNAYQERDFTSARDGFAAILSEYPGDTVAKIMLERAESMVSSPPPSDWSGVFRFRTK
jgi:adenylate cyclase